MAEGYRFHGGFLRPSWVVPYPVPTNVPEAYRCFRVFALDPSLSKVQGSVATITVPRERHLASGPSSLLFKVETVDEQQALHLRPLDIDDDLALLPDGIEPDPADARFHAQMVYAIALLTYESFRRALGRHLCWAFFDVEDGLPTPLKLRPFGMRGKNAYYDRADEEIRFGYYDAAGERADYCNFQFTSMSSDVITHEVTHALLDGLRPYFDRPSSDEVLAFHEAFGDLIALLQRFTYTRLLEVQIDRLQGRLSDSKLLLMIAPQLGKAVGQAGGLRTFRSALQQVDEDPSGESDLELIRLEDLTAAQRRSPHQLGRVLAEAIFESFHVILDRKLEPLVRLATNGSGKLPDGNLPAELLSRMVHVTKRTASQFMGICIRAVDYCPPVSIEFGDYLRALVTADQALVREDPHGYREAIIGACARRGIYPRHVATHSEQALTWDAPLQPLRIAELGLSRLRFNGDPAVPLDKNEVRRQGDLLGRQLASRPELRKAMGLRAYPDTSGDYGKPEIVSIRSSLRVGPDSQVGFDLVIEVVQSRRVTIGERRMKIHGGATLVLDPLGNVRFVVRKRVDNDDRLQRTTAFLETNQRYLEIVADERPFPLKELCFV